MECVSINFSELDNSVFGAQSKYTEIISNWTEILYYRQSGLSGDLKTTYISLADPASFTGLFGWFTFLFFQQ